MVQKSNDLVRFWRELKRRKVIHVITVYAAVAFVILQLVDIVERPLRLPDWTLALVIVLLCIGFIIAIFLSWVYDITPGGVKKTKPANAVKHIGQTTTPTSGGWKIATYVSIIIIIALLAFNFINKRSLDSNLSKLEKSIAVLPFINDSQNDSTAYFMDGVMEEILTNLQTVKNLRVISRTSVERYRTQAKSIPEIAKELDVNYIMEGSGQKSGNKFRLRVQLIRAAKESHLWAKSYEQENPEAKDYFSIQSQIAQAIATQLEAVITPHEKQLIEKLHTDNLEAYKAYLKGQFYLNKFTPSDLDSAMQYFELAKKVDPDYALAYTGICDVWAYRQQWGLVTPAEGNPKSLEAVMKAYTLDSNNAVVQYTLASKKVWGMFDWAGGEAGFQKSISLNPNSAMTHAVYSHLLNIVGQPGEALDQIDIALKLDPMNPFIMTFYGVDLYMARKYDESITAFNDALKLAAGYPFALVNLWQSFYVSGRTVEAYNTLKSFWSSVDQESLKSLEQGYLKDGLRGAFLSLADRLGELWINNQNQFFAPTDIAMLYSAGQETDKSIYWLEQAYKFRDPNLPYLLIPCYDYVRTDPRFKDLCKRMNLPSKAKL